MKQSWVLVGLLAAGCGGNDQPSGPDAPTAADATAAGADAAGGGADAGGTPIDGCSPDDLAACEYQPAITYAINPAYTQQTIEYTDVTGDTRTIHIEIRRPMSPLLPAPVVLWSHGGAGGHNDPSTVGNEIGEPFNRAGYVGVFIAHAPRSGDQIDALCAELGVASADCRAGSCLTDADCSGDDEGGRCVDGLCNQIKYLSWDRPHDVAAVLDWLDEQAAGPLAGVIDTAHIVYAGHSSGAGATMMVAGATRQLGGVDRLLLDPRPIAFISESPQGPGDDGFTESSFSGAGCAGLADDPTLCLTRPHLVLSGVGDDTGDSIAENRRVAFDLLPAGDKHLLWILEEPARHTTFEYKLDACAKYAVDEMLDTDVYPARCDTYRAWLRSAMIAFLDAHVRGEEAAIRYLASDDLAVLAAGAASWEAR